MTAVLKPDNGRLIAVRSPAGASPAVLKIPGLTDASGASIVVTSFTMSSSVSHQVTPTVGGPEYVYVFGDALGDARIGIVVYPQTCADGENASSFVKAWKYYMDNRLTPKKVKVVSLTFCGITIKGLVWSFDSEASAQEGRAVIKGTLVLRAWVDPTTIPGN